MEAQQAPSGSSIAEDGQTTNNPAADYQHTCTCFFINGLDFEIVLFTVNPIHGDYVFGPINPITANSASTMAFTAKGKEGTLFGPEGTVTYEFCGIYGQVTCEVAYNVPFKGNSSFVATLSGAVSGNSGSYTCQYTTNGGEHNLNGTVTIGFGTSVE